MKNVFYVLILILLIAVSWFAYPIIQSRYFSEDVELEREQKKMVQDEDSENDPGEDEESVINENEIDAMPDEEEPKPVEAEDALIKITNEDCKNNCKKYENDADDLKYCHESCGLSPVPLKPDEGCDSLEGLEIDYCYKDSAISKNDFKLCDKIQDAGIKKTCQNRITEDIIDNQ